MNFDERYYITYDGFDVSFNQSAFSLGLNNSYCYSQDGISCNQNYGPDCN